MYVQIVRKILRRVPTLASTTGIQGLVPPSASSWRRWIPCILPCSRTLATIFHRMYSSSAGLGKKRPFYFNHILHNIGRLKPWCWSRWSASTSLSTGSCYASSITNHPIFLSAPVPKSQWTGSPTRPWKISGDQLFWNIGWRCKEGWGGVFKQHILYYASNRDWKWKSRQNSPIFSVGQILVCTVSGKDSKKFGMQLKEQERVSAWVFVLQHKNKLSAL